MDNLYSKWRKEFHSKTDREILAMVAYRFASFYCELKDQYAKAAALADECILARSLTTAPDFSIQHLVSIFSFLRHRQDRIRVVMLSSRKPNHVK